MFDIAIVGGGPGGYVAAIRAAQMGASCVLFEADEVGGVCLNRGCIPTKTFIRSAQVLNMIKRSRIYGIDIAEVKLDYPRVLERKQNVVKQLTRGVAGLLKKNGVTLVRQRAEIVSSSEIKTESETHQVKNIILATGSKPAVPPIPGIEHAVDSDYVLSMKSLPQSVAIIGGGVIGVEFATYLASFGVKVTIVEMLPDIIAAADGDVVSVTAKMLKSLGVVVWTKAKVVSIDAGGLTFQNSEGAEQRLDAEMVLCASGRSPNTDRDALDKLGIQHVKGAIETDDHMRTNVENIYAIGDVNGKWMLAHTASAEGIVAVENILGKNSTMRYDLIPQCIYTMPEIAWVGLTEKQAKEKSIAYKKGVFPMMANGKSLIEGETAGMVKLLASESGELIGGHIVCTHATDMIAEIVLAIQMKGAAHDVARTIHAHPTVSETVMEAAEALMGKAIHI
ncbi:MAG: dihydrolipoyl dehydrogenase [Synergistaceae bacterium]|jgi:dihydrolipoamide dehydrogenase|nr:dihydrolipoyl dehydrogenase [Synergistaceae bacterium]